MTIRYAGPLCPADPAHGRLIDWPTHRFGFYCPDQSHDGHRKRPQTRAFFTTDEATAPRPAPDSFSALTGGVGRADGERPPVSSPGGAGPSPVVAGRARLRPPDNTTEGAQGN